jgi:hypothetical protein
MGSSGTRRSSDTISISTQPAQAPKSTINGGTPGGGGSSGRPRDINKMCPVKFRVKLSDNIASGSDLLLDGSSLIATDGTIVGKLNANRLKQLAACEKLGINYDIQTVADEGGSYAEFQHS